MLADEPIATSVNSPREVSSGVDEAQDRGEFNPLSLSRFNAIHRPQIRFDIFLETNPSSAHYILVAICAWSGGIYPYCYLRRAALRYFGGAVLSGSLPVYRGKRQKGGN